MSRTPLPRSPEGAGPPAAARIAAAIAALGPGGIRIAQLIAVRRDLFAPAVADALALTAPVAATPPAAARAIVAAEAGPPLATMIDDAVPLADHNPLAWTARATVAGRAARIRVTMPDHAPDPATIAAAIAIALPLLPAVDRDALRAALEQRLVLWVAADLDAAAQRRRLARWRRLALTRTGTIVARPLTPETPHVLALAALPGAALPHVVALAAEGDATALSALDIDPAATARHLIEAALEQILLFAALPVEPRLDHLAVLPGDRIARIDVGPVEPLSPPLRDALAPLLRAVVARDPALAAARIAALLVPSPTADPDLLAERLDRALQTERDDDTGAVDRFDAALAAAREAGFWVPLDLLLLGRWLAVTATAAATIDPAVDVIETARRFVLRREIEAAVALPDSGEAARRLFAVLAPLEALPDRLERWLAAATDRHYRLPVEQHRAPEDRRLRIAQARLVAVAIGWTGIALLLLVVRDVPAGIVRTGLTALLWAGAAVAAGLFARLWRRAA